MRGYAQEAAQKQRMSGAAYGAIGLGALAGGYYYYTSQNKPVVLQAEGPAPKAFQGGDQGFLSLKLESVQKISENTSKFRFALPEEDQESGLPVACMFGFDECRGLCADIIDQLL